MKNFSISILTLVAILASSSLFAQCNNFTKSKCVPGLKPYIHNGQLNSTSLAPGENAELMMTFYAGQEYRIYTCAQELLGAVEYKVMDSNHKVVFSSNEAKQNNFDFNVKATQQLYIEVSVPKAEAKTGIVEQGCVAVLVGFKK
jgi:hypothetical protein